MDSLEELLQQKNEIENSIENFAKDRDHLDANLSILFRDLKKNRRRNTNTQKKTTI